MTNGSMFYDGKRTGLELRGHATGSEAVCAGVSAIVGALAGYVANHADGMMAHPVVVLDDGYACVLVQRPDVRMLAVFDMAGIGLLQIAEQYPDFLDFSVKRGPTGD